MCGRRSRAAATSARSSVPTTGCADVRVGVAQNGHVRESRLPRVRASELVGRGWLNTGGRTVTLADLRGKIVILDFWTFCCINCLHVLDELRALEEQYRDVLVIVGVHSPKFAHEADPVALAAAVERYEVHHPVLDDPQLVTWSAYTARAWPTLVVIDPEGYVVAQMAGEGHKRNVEILVERAGRRARGQGHAAPRRRTVRPAGAQRGHAPVPRQGDRAARRAPAGRGRRAPQPRRARRPTARRWSGASGPASAGWSTAVPTRRGSASRTGCAWCPTSCGRGSGTTCSSPTRSTTRCAASGWPTALVTTVAGTGEQYMVGAADNFLPCDDDEPDEELAFEPVDRRARRRGGGLRVVAHVTARAPSAPPQPFVPGPRRQKLSSPWDVAWSQPLGAFVVAMAGNHTLWAFDDKQGSIELLGGHDERGPARRAAARGVVRAAVRARGRVPTTGSGWPTPRRRRCAGWTRWSGPCTPSSARDCSTSATATAPPTRRACSTRSASRCCPTARSSSPTPTTARSAGTPTGR